jgi:hypothetical protein
MFVIHTLYMDFKYKNILTMFVLQVIASDGTVYERAALLAWIRERERSARRSVLAIGTRHASAHAAFWIPLSEYQSNWL